uniref:Malic enzyme n=2 Tax=Rhodosorus marinus TaxID=101924 RepID=A0A7S3EKR0_9RHOD|mmetsp:Transcript_44018/g.171837  ORF Transcript_44018/g.171837 Transcript_44018/m.171837 type:complete len:590 (+) Transcript_44018:152-1921(+)
MLFVGSIKAGSVNCLSGLRGGRRVEALIKPIRSCQYRRSSMTMMSMNKRGHELLKEPSANKGTAFTEGERASKGLDGLLPPRVVSQDTQVQRHIEYIRHFDNMLDKYVYLMGILGRNEKLFFQIVMSNLMELMPVIYTPTVGEACQKFGKVFGGARGMWLSIKQHKGKIRETLQNWPEDDVRVIVVSDGERILGLGDLGAWGMGIPIGKLLLYNACGGVDPKYCLPVVLDNGCNTPALRNDPQYFGEDIDRVRGTEYDEFVDEFIQAVQARWSPQTLIQFEDFANVNAARLLEEYMFKCCCFNDDIQGTASVALAGIFGALRMPGVENDLSKHRFLFYGAGSAGIGIADLIAEELVTNMGMDLTTAKKICWFVDSKGLIYSGRHALTKEKEKYAHEKDFEVPEGATLFDIVKIIKPTAIIGVSTIPQSFTEEIINFLSETVERPIVFALSNPTSKAECTAEQAYKFSNGKAVFSSGSPFDPVTLDDGQYFVPGQGNNAYVFPGVGLGISVGGCKHVTNAMFLESAKTLASLCTEEHLKVGSVYPPISEVQDISAHIAVATCKQAEKEGLATRPVPSFEEVRKVFYHPNY